MAPGEVEDRAASLVDVLEGDPDAHEEAGGLGHHVEGVRVRLLLAAIAEVDRLKEPGRAAEDQVDQLEQARIAGELLRDRRLPVNVHEAGIPRVSADRPGGGEPLHLVPELSRTVRFEEPLGDEISAAPAMPQDPREAAAPAPRSDRRNASESMPSGRSRAGVPSPIPATSSWRTVANRGLCKPNSRYRRRAGARLRGRAASEALTTGRIRPSACLALAVSSRTPIGPEPTDECRVSQRRRVRNPGTSRGPRRRPGARRGRRSGRPGHDGP